MKNLRPLLFCFFITYSLNIQAKQVCSLWNVPTFNVPIIDCSILDSPIILDQRQNGQYISNVVADGENQLACVYLAPLIGKIENLTSVDFHLDHFPYDGVTDEVVSHIPKHSTDPNAEYFWHYDVKQQIFSWGTVSAASIDDIYVCLNFYDYK